MAIDPLLLEKREAIQQAFPFCSHINLGSNCVGDEMASRQRRAEMVSARRRRMDSSGSEPGG